MTSAAGVHLLGVVICRNVSIAHVHSSQVAKKGREDACIRLARETYTSVL